MKIKWATKCDQASDFNLTEFFNFTVDVSNLDFNWTYGFDISFPVDISHEDRDMLMKIKPLIFLKYSEKTGLMTWVNLMYKRLANGN
jgi:hypothetical protein